MRASTAARTRPRASLRRSAPASAAACFFSASALSAASRSAPSPSLHTAATCARYASSSATAEYAACEAATAEAASLSAVRASACEVAAARAARHDAARRTRCCSSSTSARVAPPASGCALGSAVLSSDTSKAPASPAGAASITESARLALPGVRAGIGVPRSAATHGGWEVELLSATATNAASSRAPNGRSFARLRREYLVVFGAPPVRTCYARGKREMAHGSAKEVPCRAVPCRAGSVGGRHAYTQVKIDKQTCAATHGLSHCASGRVFLRAWDETESQLLGRSRALTRSPERCGSGPSRC